MASSVQARDHQQLSRRHRSSTTRANAFPHDVRLDVLATVIPSIGRSRLDNDVQPNLDTITSLFKDFPTVSIVQDHFRRRHGFQACLQLLDSSRLFVDGTDGHVSFDHSRVVKNIQAVLGILLLAFSNHEGNKRYFLSRLSDSGWSPVEHAVTQCYLMLSAAGAEPNLMRDLVESVQSLAIGESDPPVTNGQDNQAEKPDISAVQPGSSSDKPYLGNGFAGESSRILHNPHAVAILATLYVRTGTQLQSLRDNILEWLRCIITEHEANRILLQRTRTFNILAASLLALDNTELAPEEQTVYLLCQSLLLDGSIKLADGALLFQCAARNSIARSLLAHALKSGAVPATINFDLSTYGHSSLELSSLQKAFPPSSGYTLTLWFRIVQFDDTCHTTLFGAFDAGQTCFVLVYLEKDSHQLILQTSVKSSRPSVRFKKFIFQPRQWYHLALVQKRPDTGHCGEVLLYVDGRFVERREDLMYPMSPAYVHSEVSFQGQASQDGIKRRAVQCFLGTPQDLADGIRTLRWSLASARLYDVCLPAELIAVHHGIGPSYMGTFQDSVGQWLTYEGSTKLNVFNEEINREHSEHSSLAKAITNRGIYTLPETNCLVSLVAQAVVDPNGRFAGSVDLASLMPNDASSRLHTLTRTGNTIIFNAAKPALYESTLRTGGHAVLTGNATVRDVQSSTRAAWILGGFLAVHIKLIDTSTSPEALKTNLEILFQSIQQNWRASESVEKNRGYGLIAMLIRKKLGLASSYSGGLTIRGTSVATGPQEQNSLELFILKLLLGFVGYNASDPMKSILINPIAYRVLLVENGTWEMAGVEAQTLYYQQFGSFVNTNQHQAFNARCFGKMRLLKFLIESYKLEMTYEQCYAHRLETFKAVFSAVASGQDHLAITAFIMYAIEHRRDEKLARRPTLRGSRPRSSSSIQNPGGFRPNYSNVPKTSLYETGVQLLGAYVAIICESTSASMLKRFTRDVAPRWLLCLLDSEDSRPVGAAIRLIVKGFGSGEHDFKRQFETKAAGFVAMKAQLTKHWRLPSVWLCCFAVMFGRDIDLNRATPQAVVLDLIGAFSSDDLSVINPGVFPSIVALLDSALQTLTSERSLQTDDEKIAGRLLAATTELLAHLHESSAAFQRFADTPKYIEGLVSVLYRAITGAERLSASAELSFESSNVPDDLVKTRLRTSSNALSQRASMGRLKSVSPTETASNKIKGPQITPPSIVIETTASSEKLLAAHLSPVMPVSKEGFPRIGIDHTAVQSLVEIVVQLLVDQVCNKKDFTGFGLFSKVPSGHQVHQSCFESHILSRTMTALWNQLQTDKILLQSPRTLNNLARYSLHMAEAVFEGWFVDGGQPLVDFTGHVLDHLQQPEIAEIKDIRLCSRAITIIRTVFLRITLLRLSELDQCHDEVDTLTFLAKLNYWQTILFSPDNQELPFIRLVCYILYTKLTSTSVDIQMAAANLFRMLLVHKPTEAATVLTQDGISDERHLPTGLMRLATHDDQELLQWVQEKREELDAYLLPTLVQHWEEFVETENRKTEETAKNRLAKRREKLIQWQTDEAEEEYNLHQLTSAMRNWKFNLHGSEKLRLQRSLQDQLENIVHMHGVIARQIDILHQTCGLDPHTTLPKWRLDQTEGRDRMRMRLSRDTKGNIEIYRPKRKPSTRMMSDPASTLAPASPTRSISPNAVDLGRSRSSSGLQAPNTDKPDTTDQADLSSSSLLEGDFELVEDPRSDHGGFEDKNRKVMRSLKSGDQIRQVFNVSRLIGLEACGGLLVIGKRNLYLQDGLFQRSDDEIVSIAQAPSEERDHYVQMISGREINTQPTMPILDSTEPKSWAWTDVLSLSKRRFLFRDVAIEVFFIDGRSYLLILISPALRDKVFAEMSQRAPHVGGELTSPIEAEGWRLSSLRVTGDAAPSSFGSRFANVFNSAVSDTPAKKWARGDLSNFNYLMMVNTMAGRTFNDLTQYPVFPWVLADFTSEELDLTNPRSFRDLSKPMGCQTASREAEFRERYQSFADMGDEKPFHFGTHYSSAMIVTSYLIRLQPFVQSYLLLQGGAFDHADRLFDSIGKAWTSASQQNMSDVRELTPEFFYLPEFLTNINGYDFGQRDANSQTINHVELPPWAKNDPHVFIAKHREALESDYVSEHLHLWIDLVFGCKQRGESALAATNIFHPLSYHGAKDLDAIDDPVERMATIGIIHNFGQTPHQVFPKPHSPRELQKHNTDRLDTLSQTLTKLPNPVITAREKAITLVYSTGLDKILAAPAYRLYLLPNSRQYCQWLYADNSLRFFSTESRRLLNLYEELHVGPITAAVCADARTLITAGAESTIGIWDIISSAESVNIVSRTYLFGHRAAITGLAVSRALSIIVSASADGQVITWDLNHHDCIRILRPADSYPAIRGIKINNVTGHIALASGPIVLLYTLNGHLLLSQRASEASSSLSTSSSNNDLSIGASAASSTIPITSDNAQDGITALAFYEGAGNEYIQHTLLFTGHARGVAKVWCLVTLSDGSWHLQLVKHLEHMDLVLDAPLLPPVPAIVTAGSNSSGVGGVGGVEGYIPAITSILPMARKVYCGDEAGRVWQWDCVPRPGRR